MELGLLETVEKERASLLPSKLEQKNSKKGRERAVMIKYFLTSFLSNFIIQKTKLLCIPTEKGFWKPSQGGIFFETKVGSVNEANIFVFKIRRLYELEEAAIFNGRRNIEKESYFR